MSKKDIFGDEIVENNKTTFEEFLQKSSDLKSHKMGQRINGKILSISKDTVLVDIGSHVDGVMSKLEIIKDTGELLFEVGQSIDCVIKKISPDSILLRYEGSKIGFSEDADLEDAFDYETPIEGKVLEEVKGGFRVMLPGSVKAFCPVSQIDFRVTEPKDYIGQKFEFIIIQYAQGGRNVVVSRRRALDAQKVQIESEFLKQTKPEQLLGAEVIRLEKFGAFVKLEDWGLEGLIPLSELAWNRIRHPDEVVQIGAKIQVMFLGSQEDDSGRLKLSFSLKKAGADGDPWAMASLKFAVGTVILGTVEKKEAFGLFVSLQPQGGVTGLLPKSMWKDSLEFKDFENKKRGDPLTVVIKEINYEAKKILLGIPGDQDEPVYQEGLKSKSLGTFADLFNKNNSKKK